MTDTYTTTDHLESLIRSRADHQQVLAKLKDELAFTEGVIADYEARIRATLEAVGADKVRLAESGATVQLIRRRDMRITDADEFAAAMVENGMEVPMTEPKIDTRALKEIAKRLPDWPGAEPFETVMLKVVMDG